MDLVEQLTRDEGVKRYPYRDSVGKLTIGVGRNLDDVGISTDEINLMLANDIHSATVALEYNFPWTSSLDEARRGAMLNMTFNMGIHGLMGFRDFLGKMQAGDYAGAANAMLDSKWAQQVGARAQRLSIQIETGIWQ
jgi:lysozyme